MPKHKFITRISISILFIIVSISSKAQTPTYEMYITNQLQVDTKTYQFDVYVLNSGTPVLEMANIQLGIGFDTSITNGGTLSVALVSGSSQLVASQVPQNIFIGGAYFTVNGVVYRSINQTQRTGPGSGNGTIISKIKTSCTSPGTRIGTYRLTNTKDFKISSITKHIFNTVVGTQRVASAMSCYVNGFNTIANGSFYNYNTNGTCDQNLVLNECSISTTISTTGDTYLGQSIGTATISLTGIGLLSTGTYKYDGGSSILFSSNSFTLNNLYAGTHSILITTGICETTKSFTIEGPVIDSNLHRPPKPGFIKVTPLIFSDCGNEKYRLELEEELPLSTATSVFANGWQWQFGGNLAMNAIIDSGTMNSKIVVVEFTNRPSYTTFDSVKVCYTSIIGNGPYRTRRLFKFEFKKIPIPSHILVKALEPSQEGYRRFRYSAPDSIPVETDSTVHPTGWQWSFVGNLSQSVVIDSGNYNSKEIVVKIISNDAENSNDSVKLAYTTSCGVGRYANTKYTRTSGHKFIFDNRCDEGNLLPDWNGNMMKDYTEVCNWDQYPGTHLIYGDTVIISAWCAINTPVVFDYGTVLILDDSYYSFLDIQNNLTSNSKIVNNGWISFFNERGNLLGNYFMLNNGIFQAFNTSFIQPGTIINNGLIEMGYYSSNYGYLVNNGYLQVGNNYGTIEIGNNNNINFSNWFYNGFVFSGSNFGTIVNNVTTTLNSSNINETTGKIINNKSLNLDNFINYGQIINYDSLNIYSNFENYADSLVLNSDIFIDGIFNNYNKLINHGKLVLNNNGSIFNSDIIYNPNTGLFENSTFINEIDGRIKGVGYINNQGISINKGEIKCSFIINNRVFINNNFGIIDGALENYSDNFTLDTSQFVFENRGVINLPNYNGWFDNHNGIFKNYGIFNNYSSWAWEQDSYFKNYGTFNNYTEYYPSHTINYGLINNDSIINLFNDYQERTIDNYSIINNNGSITGSGGINNINGIIINNGIVSPGSTRNASIDTLNDNTTSRSVINTISPSSTNETFKIGSLTFSDFIGTPTFEIEIADTSRTTGHDFVTVNDTLNAGGTINLAISYLPNPNDEITIMHADTVLNQFDTVNIPAGWSVLYNHPNKGDISVKYDKTNLNVKAFLEGYYNGNSTMNTLLHNIGLTEDATAVDSIEVQMWSPDYLNLSEPTFSSKTILHNDGNANLSLPINMIDRNYYICIKHKNSIETWSAEPITISTVNNYDFTISQDKAYSNNLNNPLKSMPDGNFAIYSGDTNQDGTIDIYDMMNAENDAINLSYGNVLSDCNGDGTTDVFDMQLIENNAGLIIYYASPR